MLQIKSACIAYGEEVLFSKFDLQLMPGEIACICGQSGGGKTSLLNAIMGFVPLQKGSISMGGVELDERTIEAFRRQIAWIPQELALPSEWVRDMVRLPFELKVNRQQAFSEERLFSSFEILGLEKELYRKRVRELSGGQRQRIMIAVAALLQKPLLLADEPTSALDADSSERVVRFLQLQAAEGMTILVVSHDEAVAAGAHKRIELL